MTVGVTLQKAMRAIKKANPETLFGIFGDASLTNKDRLSDETLTNLIEHYSQHKLNLSTPPQGFADYAFQQHIQKSLDKNNGRSISLWPHGILFRDAEAKMRRKMIEEDLVECVIGLGPNLFYNSPMEACE